MASHILLSFHCRQKGQELLICSRQHLTSDSCLLFCQPQMANLRKSPGVGFTTKQIYTVGQRCEYLLTLSLLGLQFCLMLTHSSRFATSANLGCSDNNNNIHQEATLVLCILNNCSKPVYTTLCQIAEILRSLVVLCRCGYPDPVYLKRVSHELHKKGFH